MIYSACQPRYRHGLSVLSLSKSRVFDSRSVRAVLAGSEAMINGRMLGICFEDKAMGGRKIIDLSGQPFGSLTALYLVGDNPKRYMWLCLCDCGNQRLTPGSKLTGGTITSCRDCSLRRATKHGHAKQGGEKRHSPTYNTWAGMHSRCSNPNTTGYEYYGGAGISVCARWKSFEAFLRDMGEKPTGTSIDRTNGSGNYEPGNCRWATKVEQANNTSSQPHSHIRR